MTKIRDIEKYLSRIAPYELSEEWDNDGIMLCKSDDVKVTKVLVCLEINPDAIKKAKDVGAQLIVTHHPLIFRPIKNIKDSSYLEFEALVKNDISVLSCHTRLDKAQGGVNDILAQKLGLINIRNDSDFLRYGELCEEIATENFADYLREKLACGKIKAYFEKGRKIKTVAVCGGAGKDFLVEAANVADAYLSSDFSHNTFIDAKNLGVAIYDAGHYSTENPVVQELVRLLTIEFPEVEFESYDIGCPFFVV